MSLGFNSAGYTMAEKLAAAAAAGFTAIEVSTEYIGLRLRCEDWILQCLMNRCSIWIWSTWPNEGQM